MAVQTPKTDWKFEDYINFTDFERIQELQLYTIRRIVARLSYDYFDIYPNRLNNDEAYIFMTDINHIEQNLELIAKNAGQASLDWEFKVWKRTENDNFNFEDANRWERTIEQIKNNIYYASLWVPHCGVFNSGQSRLWQVRFRNLSGRMWEEWEEYDYDWQTLDSFDKSWGQVDTLPI